MRSVLPVSLNKRTCTPKSSCEMASISLLRNRGRALLQSGSERSQPIIIGACTQGQGGGPPGWISIVRVCEYGQESSGTIARLSSFRTHLHHDPKAVVRLPFCGKFNARSVRVLRRTRGYATYRSFRGYPVSHPAISAQVRSR
jgi:hypothetical protein